MTGLEGSQTLPSCIQPLRCKAPLSRDALGNTINPHSSDFEFFLTNLPLGKPGPLTSLTVPERTALPAQTGRDARNTLLSPVYE